MANDPKLSKFKKKEPISYGYLILGLVIFSIIVRIVLYVQSNNAPDAPVTINEQTAQATSHNNNIAVTAKPLVVKFTGPVKDISLPALATMIANDEVANIKVQSQKVSVDFKDGSRGVTYKESESSFTDQLIAFGVTPMQLAKVNIDIKTNTGVGYWLSLILPFLLPVLIIAFIVYTFGKQLKSANGKAMDFGQTKARFLDPSKKQTTFKDVAGNIEAKEELAEVVDFLKNPKKYIDIGAKIPRGVLLAGSPGTGKTLLARAVAGEAGVPFFHLSGSEFVEMFVGVGASRVRDLFALAKKSAPAIIFMDEIDAVGRHRGVGIGGGNDEREQTLNQMLVEMDGFEPNEAVIILAATNRPDVLDEALLRPGRFDRRVMLDLPDKKDRIEILNIYATKKKMGSDINFEVIASRTPGFSGADLESLLNEAAIKAARSNREVVDQQDIIESIEKVMMGPQKQSHIHTEEERKLVAYHEAGHAVVASILPKADPVHKVTIIPRGFAGGYTLKLPTDERKLQTKAHYIDELAVCLGGMAAEDIIFKDITPGASSDLQNATSIARAMVAKWGMSDAIGPIAIDSLTKQGGFGEVAITASQTTFTLLDSEVRKLLDEALAHAKHTITQHKDLLEKITQLLLEKETIEQDEFNEILKSFNVAIKKSTAVDVIA